jgi:DNA-binding SARP family transcriptional activator
MLRVRLLGELTIEADEAVIDVPPGRPVRTLLGWLALHPGVHARSTVAGTLWPDVLEESARRSLRNALSVLRQSLPANAANAIIATRETVGLADEPQLRVDVQAFDQLATAGRAEEALELCRGELLAGLDDDWVLRARDEHRERRSRLLAALATAAQTAGDLERAVTYARRRAALDPLDEPAQRDLMLRLAVIGDRAGALASYEAFAERLRRELGVAPSAQTRALARELRDDPIRVAQPLARASAAPVSGYDGPALPPRLDHARQRSELLGRAVELSRLQELWTRATRQGERRVVFVVGEPGIGKTRLAGELAALVDGTGAAVIYGRAEEDALCPYQPLVEGLRDALEGSRTVPPELAPLLPKLADASGEAPQPLSDDTTDVDAGRLRLFEAVADQLALVAGSRPLLLIVDDLHWADRPTLRLLSHLAARPDGPFSMVLGTYRETELSEDHPLVAMIAELRRDVPVEQLQLRGLSLTAIAELMERALERLPDPKMVRSLHEQTAGNPFFVEELVRSLGQAGSASDDRPRLPDGAAQVVAQRVGRLQPSTQALLTAGALIGPEFDLYLAAEVVGLPADAALDAVAQAVRANVVGTVEDGPGRYSFVHALARDALTAALNPGRRARLHALIAQTLQPRAEADPNRYLQLLAHHALEAAPVGDPDAAVDVAQRAATRASDVYAHEDAAVLLQRALTVLEAVGATPRTRAEMLCTLGEALARAGSSSAAQEAFEQAAALARSVGDPRLLARTALGAHGIAVTIFEPDHQVVARLEEALVAIADADDAVRARLLARLTIELGYDPDSARRESASQEAVTRALASTDATALAAALGARHVALWGPQHAPARLRCADDMLTAAQQAGALELELQARNWRALDLLELGRGAELRAEVEQFATLASRARLPSYSWYVPMWRASLALMEGHIEQAMELARRAREMGQRAGDSNAEMCFIHHRFMRLMMDDRHSEALGEFYADDLAYATRKLNSPAGPTYRMTLAWLLSATGRYDEAREYFELIAADGFSTVPRDVNWLAGISSAADACLLLKDGAHALELRHLLEPFADRITVSARGAAFRGSASRLLAQLSAMLADNDAADAYYERARQLDEQLGAPVWVAHDLCHHGQFRLSLGDTPGGLQLLDQAADIANVTGLERLGARIKRAKTEVRERV